MSILDEKDLVYGDYTIDAEAFDQAQEANLSEISDGADSFSANAVSTSEGQGVAVSSGEGAGMSGGVSNGCSCSSGVGM